MQMESEKACNYRGFRACPESSSPTTGIPCLTCHFWQVIFYLKMCFYCVFITIFVYLFLICFFCCENKSSCSKENLRKIRHFFKQNANGKCKCDEVKNSGRTI